MASTMPVWVGGSSGAGREDPERRTIRIELLDHDRSKMGRLTAHRALILAARPQPEPDESAGERGFPAMRLLVARCSVQILRTPERLLPRGAAADDLQRADGSGCWFVPTQAATSRWNPTPPR